MSQQQDILNNLLIEAVRSKDLAQAKLYVQKGADPNCHVKGIPVTERSSINSSRTFSVSGPVLHLAGCTGQFNGAQNGFSSEMTDFLISAGARVDDKNDNGDTMLMVSVKAYASVMVKYWLGKGASPLATDARGDMVIKLASNIDQNSGARQNIINALMAKMPDTTAQNAAAAATPVPEKAAAVQGDIDVMKPVTVVRRTGHKPRGGGFTL
ncbi:MAG: hypothetical protein Q8K65_03990 [Alphaproteobacteria bacterium]|nr:hypothetical protein [Alphaproteobacteria bacterium]